MVPGKKVLFGCGAIAAFCVFVISALSAEWAANWKLDERLSEDMAQITKSRVVIQGSRLNILTGEGKIDLLVISDRDANQKNLFEVSGLDFEFSRLGVIFGSFDLTMVEIADGMMTTNVIGSGVRLRSLYQRIEAFQDNEKSEGEFKPYQLTKFSAGSGVMKIGAPELDAEITREVPFNAVSLEGVGNSDVPHTRKELMRKMLLSAVGTSLQATGTSLLR